VFTESLFNSGHVPDHIENTSSSLNEVDLFNLTNPSSRTVSLESTLFLAGMATGNLPAE
jgi:hypothetical protein